MLRSHESLSPLNYKPYPADIGYVPASGLATPSPASRHQSSEWSNHEFPEFVPQSFNNAPMVSHDILSDASGAIAW